MDSAASEVVGRDSELATLHEFVGSGHSLRALALTGRPGIGKTTLWEAGIDAAQRRGLLVLSARPSDAEAQHSFAALIDLCAGIDAGVLTELAAPQRRALEVALLRAEPVGDAPEPHAISLAFLNALRALSARGPVLVAVDDVQWVDTPSADALVFAARRLETEPVGFLLARRAGRTSALERAFERAPFQRVDVGPLGLGPTRRLLAERIGLSLSRPVLRRVVESTLGNPLFALEVGRRLAESGPPGIGADLPVPARVEDMLGTRVLRLPPPLRRLLLAVSLSADLRLTALVTVSSAAEVEDAVEAGLLIVDGDRVRASHPLLATAAKKRSRAAERRELHLALAGAVDDERLRALHLALAAGRPDAELAAVVGAAATGASAHGARQEAVELAEHALRLTPPESVERSNRLLALAGYLERAGELQRITDLLTPELETLPAGSARARAWVLLSEGAGVRSLDDLERHLDAALADGGDDAEVRSLVLAKKAGYTAAGAVSQIRQAETWALEALSARHGGGAEAERLALDALSWTRSLSGRPVDDLVERFQETSESASFIAESPARVAAQRLLWRGDVKQAREALTRFLSLADEQGESVSYALQRLHLCELELRAGGWAAASLLLGEWAESADRDLLLAPMYERCRALLAAGEGLPDEAERWAAQAIADAEATGFRWDGLEALRARGIAALLAGDPARALESLRSVWDHTEREGVDEPGVFPVAPELVEALTETGDLDAALAVTGRLRELAEQQQHPWALATAERSGAVVQLAGGTYDKAAATALAQAADDYERLGLRFDRARSLLSLGRAQRRLKQWRAARGSLEGAVAEFEQLGSAGWSDHARSELARVGARRPRPAGELTPSEGRVARLAADGHSNKEIAQMLFITVHTVEAHLSKTYAKLGVRSRSQLAGRLPPSA